MPKAAIAALLRKSTKRSALALDVWLSDAGMCAHQVSAAITSSKSRQADICAGRSSQKKPVPMAATSHKAPPAKRQRQYWVAPRYHQIMLSVLLRFML